MHTVTGLGFALGAAAKKPVAKKATASSATKEAAKRLQAALLLLGKIAGSPSLKAIVVDGAPGAKTAAAVNLTFTKHLGPGQAPAQYRTGKLPLSYITANANTLAEYIEAEIRRRGGQPVSTGVATKAGLTTAIKASGAIPSGPVSKDAVKRLQTALVNLGRVAGSPSLKAIKVDGALGAKTVAAVNLTFTKHIGSGQAPAQYRTGNLPLAYVGADANNLASYIEAEIKRRGGAAGSSTAASGGASTPASKDVIKRLQLSLATLGSMTGSAQLKAVKVDGALGAKTVTAVNWAFTKHIGAGQAPAQYRTGNLPLDYVKGNATVLASMIEAEIKRRGGKVVAKVLATAKKVKTRSGHTVTAQKVSTESGDTYEVTDNTGHTYFTTDPTNDPPPTPPEGLPEPTDEQVATAAEASAAAAKPGRSPVVSPAQIPADAGAEDESTSTAMTPSTSTTRALTPSSTDEGGGDESFFAQHKWPIIGSIAAAALIGVGVVVLKKKQGQTQLQPQRKRAQ